MRSPPGVGDGVCAWSNHAAPTAPTTKHVLTAVCALIFFIGGRKGAFALAVAACNSLTFVRHETKGHFLSDETFSQDFFPMRLDEILTEANRARATDVFLTAGAVPCIQCDGIYSQLRLANGQRLSPELSQRLAREAMTERQWSDFEKNMEANLAYMTESAGRYRINVYYQRGTIGLVCRRVDRSRWLHRNRYCDHVRA